MLYYNSEEAVELNINGNKDWRINVLQSFY